MTTNDNTSNTSSLKFWSNFWGECPDVSAPRRDFRSPKVIGKRKNGFRRCPLSSFERSSENCSCFNSKAGCRFICDEVFPERRTRHPEGVKQKGAKKLPPFNRKDEHNLHGEQIPMVENDFVLNTENIGHFTHELLCRAARYVWKFRGSFHTPETLLSEAYLFVVEKGECSLREVYFRWWKLLSTENENLLKNCSEQMLLSVAAREGQDLRESEAASLIAEVFSEEEIEDLLHYCDNHLYYRNKAAEVRQRIEALLEKAREVVFCNL